MVSVTYSIDNAKYAAFKTAFIRRFPVPVDRKGVPTISEDNWIKECGRQFFVQAYVDGQALISQDSITDDAIIVT